MSRSPEPREDEDDEEADRWDVGGSGGEGVRTVTGTFEFVQDVVLKSMVPGSHVSIESPKNRGGSLSLAHCWVLKNRRNNRRPVHYQTSTLKKLINFK